MRHSYRFILSLAASILVSQALSFSQTPVEMEKVPSKTHVVALQKQSSDREQRRSERRAARLQRKAERLQRRLARSHADEGPRLEGKELIKQE